MNKNKNSKDKAVFGPPPKEALGKPIALWKRVILGSFLSAVVIAMLWLVLWMLDQASRLSL